MPRATLVRTAGICVAIPLVVIGALWPAGLYKLSLIKTYLFFSYISAIRNQAYGTAPLWQVWWTRFLSSPFEYVVLLCLCCYALSVFVRRRQYPYLQPFLLYALLMTATTIRNHSQAAIHVLSLIPCLGVLAAFAVYLLLKNARPPFSAAMVAVLVAALAVNNYWFYYRKEVNKPGDEVLTAAVNTLRTGNVGGQRLLVPQNLVPTLHYYFRNTNLTGYTENASVQEVFRSLAKGGFHSLIYEGERYQDMRSPLDRNLSVQIIVIPEAGKPGRAVAYYHLEPMGSKGG